MQIILKKEFDESLKKDWLWIEENNDLIIYQTYKWNKDWVKYNNINDIKIFTVYVKNRPVLIFPFFITNFFFFKILKWISFDNSDYLGPIIDRNYKINDLIFKQLWNEILLQLKPECDLLYLEKISDHKTLFFNPINEYLRCLRYKINYGINFLHWNSFLKNKNKSLQQYRSKKKKLSLIGDFEFIWNVKDVDEKKKLISKMIKWKKQKKNDNKYLKTFEDTFYFNYLENNNFILSAIKINDQYIAGILGFIFKNNYYFLIPSYQDEIKFKKLSPGRILLIDLISCLDKLKITFFNFCDGNQFYKKEWSNEEINLKIYLKPNNLRGYLLERLLRIKFNL